MATRPNTHAPGQTRRASRVRRGHPQRSHAPWSPVTEIDSRLSTRRHHVCNQVLPSETDTATSVVVECPHCGVVFDQDQNAVIYMLREHSDADRASLGASHTRDGAPPGRALESRRSSRTQPKVPVR